ncbi:MAG: tRNA1(Val) (adenine(37)-N6)-methyltransferase, partial [Candidatus Binataceae bacterium]
MKLANPDETVDRILGGALPIVQPRKGYRFSVDALLLGRFALASRRDRVLELGAGCGVVSVLLAAAHQPRELIALEIQPELAAMVARNFELSNLRLCTAVQGDLRSKIDGLEPASFDLVVSNPPFRAPRSGRESPNESRRIARGASGATLREFIAAASRYVRHGGRVAIVFTAARTAELIGELRDHSLEPKRIRFVHPRFDLPANTILVEARKGGGVEAVIEPSLILYSAPGVY